MEPEASPTERAWWPWALFGLATFALLWSPLLGLRSLLPIDIVELFVPWSHAPASGLDGVTNGLLGDTFATQSHFASMFADLRGGDFSFWDRSVGGGIPTLKAGLSPINWVYLIVPAWYAPGLAAAARSMVAAGLSYGLARRLGLSRGAAAVTGIAYGFSGFLIGWSGWPQSNVAAFLPGLFWAVESLVQRPRWRTASGLALAVAAMVWSNFPVITVYAMLFAALYAAIRVAAASERGGRTTAFVRRAPIAIWGVLLGLGLSSYHIVHFGENLRWADNGPRERLPADTSLGAEYLPSFLLPEPYGASHDGATFWAPSSNWVELQSYAGLTVVVLALLSLCAQGRRRGGTGMVAHRAAAARVWWAIVIVVAWLAYVGGPLTEAVNSLPTLSFSGIGRIRVVANLGLAVLAGLGVQAWIDAHRKVEGVDLRRGLRSATVGVVVLGVVTAPFSWAWVSTTRDAGVLKEAATAAMLPVLLAAVAAVALWRARSVTHRGLVVAALPLLVAVDLIVPLRSVNTLVEPSSADITTDAHRATIEALDPGERMGGEGRVFFANSAQLTGLDDVRFHGFTPPGFREIYRTLDPDHFRPPGGTVGNPYFASVDLTNPVLDKLGVGVWAADPWTFVVGARAGEPIGDTEVALGPGESTTVVRGVVPEGGLRGIGVAFLSSAPGRLVLTAVADGNDVATSAPIDDRPRALDLAFPVNDLTPGSDLTLTFTFESDAGEIELIADDAGIAFETIAGGDGFEVVTAGDVVVYDRGDRVGAHLVHAVGEAEAFGVDYHLASAGAFSVFPAERAAIDLPSETPNDAEGRAEVREAEGGSITVDVESSHPGLVVIAQPEYPGWSATVDGRPADIVRVDDAFPAVVVPAGSSVVELSYRPTHLTATAWITLLAALGVLGTARIARRRADPADPVVATGAANSEID